MTGQHMKTSVSEHPFEKLQQRAKDAEKRIQENTPALQETRSALEQELGNDNSLVTRTLINEIEKHYLHGEQMGLFNSYDIKPSSEFPSLLCRLPIFMASRSQAKFLDKDFGLNFKTKFGSGRRLGPPVNTKDEDVLMALGRLRSKRISGSCENLPIPVPKQYLDLGIGLQEKSGKVDVDTLFCTVTQILDELNLSNGGDNYKSTVSSLKRLGAVILELNVNKNTRYFGEMEMGRPFKIIDIEWALFREQGMIMVQFTPLIVHWLINEFTYVDWSVRSKLKSDSAKAIHRFLSSQKREYKGNLADIAETVGVTYKTNRLKKIFQSTLEQLTDLGWLDGFRITGTGRKTPFVIETWRRTRNK